MNQREVPPVARRVKRGRRLTDVLADDGDVPDLAVALSQLVMCKADGTGIVGELGLLQRAGLEPDRPRLIAARRREAAVQPPERREPSGGHGFAQRVGCASKRRGRLVEIVLKQPRLGEHRSHRELVFARQRAGAERGRQHLRRRCALTAFENGGGAREQCTDGT